jgi:hypothetical protein
MDDTGTRLDSKGLAGDELHADGIMPAPRSGQLLLEVQYLSLDPYMRGRIDDRESYAKPLQIGDVMTGETVSRVIASLHPDYSEGDFVLAQTGWQTHAVSDEADLRKLDPSLVPVTTRPRRSRHAGIHRVRGLAPDRQTAAWRNCGRTSRQWSCWISCRPVSEA